MTLNEALILSYIKRGIGYGYNILAHVKKSGSDEWVDFSRAGLYKTLYKLEQDGLLSKSFEQTGGRPPKKVYTITPDGDSELNDFLERGFDFSFQIRDAFDAYLVTAVAASPDAEALARAVGKRKEAVRGQLTTLEEEFPQDKDEFPFIVYVLYRKRLESLETELKWLDWFESVLESVSGDVLHMLWGETHA